jgi:hypothetical protein
MLECECCHERPAAFRMKHGETSVHWRCLGCFRDIARGSPVVVVGVATPARTIEHEMPLVDLFRFTRALLDSFKGRLVEALDAEGYARALTDVARWLDDIGRQFDDTTAVGDVYRTLYERVIAGEPKRHAERRAAQPPPAACPDCNGTRADASGDLCFACFDPTRAAS